jgi:rhamnosyltransferase
MLACAIVTYNPEPERFTRVLQALRFMFDEVYIYSNLETDRGIILDILKMNSKDFENFVLLDYYGDLGLAAAQNKLAKFASTEGHSWVTFLDQDSVVNDTSSLLRAAVCTATSPTEVFAISYPKNSVSFMGSRKYFNSSSMTLNINYFLRLGGFKDELCIDWVDFEICDRIYRTGGSFRCVDGIEFAHQLGERQVSILGRKIHLRSDIRYYYVLRNAIHLILREKLSINFNLMLFLRLCFYIPFYCYISNSKRIIFMAIWHGVIGRLGLFIPKSRG